MKIRTMKRLNQSVTYSEVNNIRIVQKKNDYDSISFESDEKLSNGNIVIISNQPFIIYETTYRKQQSNQYEGFEYAYRAKDGPVTGFAVSNAPQSSQINYLLANTFGAYTFADRTTVNLSVDGEIWNCNDLFKYLNEEKGYTISFKYSITDNLITTLPIIIKEDYSQDKEVLDGLLGWWNGIKSTKTVTQWNDISGNNNHITFANATITDNQYNFNGTNTLGQIPINMNIFNNGATIITTVRYDVFSNFKGVIGDHTSSGSTGVDFGQYNTTNGLEFGFYPPTTAVNVINVPTSSLTNGTTAFNEIAMTYDKNILKVTVNGQEKLTKTIGQITMASRNMVLGRAFDSSNRYLQGAINDVKIYGRALGLVELQQNYNANKKAGLVQ